MTRVKTPRVLLMALVLSLFTISVSAEVPKVISYQGRLTDADGIPVPDGDYELTFQITEHDPLPMGEDPLWSSGVQTVTVADGLFDYYLGSNVPLPAEIFNNDGLDSYFLRIKPTGSLVYLQGTELVTTPFAIRSIYSDTAAYAASGPGGGSSGWVDDGTVVRLATSSDNVGIGTSSPSERLVVGKNLGNFGQKYIVSGSYALDDVCGIKMGYSGDEHATLEWNGDGPSFAIHTKRLGTNYNNTVVVNNGMVGVNNAYPDELFTIGPSLGAAYGDMISICNNGASNKYSGIMFGEDVQNKATILWYNGANEMRLQTESNDTVYSNTMVLKGGNIGVGVTSTDSAALTIEKTYNIPAPSQSGRNGISVVTTSTGSGGIIRGGYFEAKGTGTAVTGIKVEAGETGGTEGVAGIFQSSNGYGIFASGPILAGDFNGSVDVKGNLSKLSGSFKIDHPLDPENKYLQHSFVESPDMMNIYNGNVVTDAEGFAEIIMPEYFEVLNMDFRYQLTVIGEFAQAIIGEKITNGRFTIKTDKPNIEVSWQVTGVRQDPWANEHRIQVEIDKPNEVRGYFIAPELYGYGAERSIDYKEGERLGINSD